MSKAFLEKWSKSLGKSTKELKKEYDRIEHDVEETYSDKSETEKERITKQLFGKHMRRLKYSRSKAEDFFGFILGCSRLTDIAEFMRRKALAAYRDDPIQAQLQGIVDENGTPLDPREKMGNRDNPNFHKPLTEHIYNRKIYGVAIKEGTKAPMFFRMTLWRNSAKMFRYKPYLPIGFKAILKDMKKGFYELNASKLTKFQATKRTIDFENWMRDSSQPFIALNELKDHAAKTKGTYDNWCFTEGDVDLINPTVNPNTNCRSIILSDADKGMIETVRIFIPADFPLAFSELSRVIVLGKVRLWKREGEAEERVSMEGYSVFALPGQTIVGPQPTETGSAPTRDEGPVIEFIEEVED